MSRLHIGLSVVAACAVGAAAYWSLGNSPPAGPSGQSQYSEHGLERASARAADGRAGSVGAASQRPVAEVLERGDVAAASRQALESAERGVETGDLTALRKLRAAVDARARDELLSSADDDALDLAIACLAEDPEAREDAREFFRDEPATSLHMQVKRVCLGQP